MLKYQKKLYKKIIDKIFEEVLIFINCFLIFNIISRRTRTFLNHVNCKSNKNEHFKRNFKNS